MRNRLTAMAGAEVRIGISKRSLTIVRCGAFGRNASLLLAEQLAEDASMESIITQCLAALSPATVAGLPLSITLGDELVRLFMVTPPQNAARMQDLVGSASMRFHALFGETPRDWRIEADWRAGTAFLACALPQAMVEQCKNLARNLQMPLTELKPHFICAWNMARGKLANNSDKAWLAVLRGAQLTLGMTTPGAKQVSAIRGINVPAERAGIEWLQEQATRAALQAGLTAPSRLLLAGDARGDWTEAGNGKLEVVRFDKETMPGTRILSPTAPLPALAKASST